MCKKQRTHSENEPADLFAQIIHVVEENFLFCGHRHEGAVTMRLYTIIYLSGGAGDALLRWLPTQTGGTAAKILWRPVRSLAPVPNFPEGISRAPCVSGGAESQAATRGRSFPNDRAHTQKRGTDGAGADLTVARTFDSDLTERRSVVEFANARARARAWELVF